MQEPTFKGTLLLLQNRTKKDPESYREEFKGQSDHFNAMVSAIGGSDTGAAGSTATTMSAGYSNPQFLSVMSYVVHCSHCYPKECANLASQIIKILVRSKTTLDCDTRMAFVQNLMLLRSKNLVAAETTLPLFFDLLLLRDKALRKCILSHIVGDVRRINMRGHKNGTAVNKAVQNFLFSIVKDDDPVQARKASLVMIDLYRRKVWADERTVQVLTTCCFSRHTAIVRTALRFFLLQLPKISSVDDSEDEEDIDAGREISKLKQKLKVKKKTKKRERILDRTVKEKIRKYDKEEQEEISFMKQHIDPIRLLRDPHQFAEQLLHKLQKTSERFEVRILFLSVIARVVSEHQVVLLPLYAFLERYMEPSQLHATQLLALSASCIHRMVPPESVEPLIKAIANHFVNDRSEADSITIGINTIREMCKRQPLAISADLLSDLIEYKQQRGDKGVVMAARALLQLYRDVNPEILPAKYHGASASAIARRAVREADDISTSKASKTLQYGATKPLLEIPGMELLLKYYTEKGDTNTENASTVNAGEFDSDNNNNSDDSDDSDDSFETESEEFFSSATSEDCDDNNNNNNNNNNDDDDVPLLVPVSRVKDGKEGDSNKEPDNDYYDDCVTVPRIRKKLRAEDNNNNNKSITAHEGEDSGEEYDGDDDEDDISMIDISDSEGSEGEWVECGSNDSSEDEEEEEEEEEDDAANISKIEEKDKNNKIQEITKIPLSKPCLVADGAFREDTTPSLSKPTKDKHNNNNNNNNITATLHTLQAFGGNISAANTYERVSNEQRGVATSIAAASLASTSGSSMAAVGLLSDADFAKIRRLRYDSAHNTTMPMKGKKKEQEARMAKKERLIHGISSDLTAGEIESFTVRKKDTDREAKIAKMQELRKEKQPFNARAKKKSKIHCTHKEHSKRGKLFQMTKRSMKVAAKLKSSKVDRGNKVKDNKSKDIKFRIKRGWKA